MSKHLQSLGPLLALLVLVLLFSAFTENFASLPNLAAVLEADDVWLYEDSVLVKEPGTAERTASAMATRAMAIPAAVAGLPTWPWRAS